MKIGFVSLPLTGHLNPMTALARKLESRGDEVVFIGVPDAEPAVRAANLNFVPFGEKAYPAGSVAKDWGPVAKLHGEEVVRYSCREISPRLLEVALEHLPEKLAETGVEALVIDTIHTFVELVPMSMGIPYVHIWNILHIDLSGATPACLFSSPHETTPEALARNLEGLKTTGEIFAPIVAVAKPYAEKMGLQIDWNDPTATTSKLAVITQTPKEFDFPGSPWPAHFHYAGPLHDNEGREPVPFPWDKLTDKPLVYASLGTLVNGLDHVYKTILGAVGRLPGIQVVLSVGKNVNPDDLGPIPSNAIVVRSAPQIELLKRAVLCITHAGLNTALEALAQGVPMVAIPIGYDQPGVAARIAYHGVGEFMEIQDLTVERLSKLIQSVLEDPDYRSNAIYFQEVIEETRGLDVAADVIGRVFEEYQTENSANGGIEFSHA
ncbi:MAG: glycosyltransferase, family [Edaphobacter sp.]|nr:glycosyltransferase, family [Edaphobacter sp.]